MFLIRPLFEKKTIKQQKTQQEIYRFVLKSFLSLALKNKSVSKMFKNITKFL